MPQSPLSWQKNARKTVTLGGIACEKNVPVVAWLIQDPDNLQKHLQSPGEVRFEAQFLRGWVNFISSMY